jgi:hypothetical protein
MVDNVTGHAMFGVLFVVLRLPSRRDFSLLSS